jgi:hypothetical protein
MGSEECLPIDLVRREKIESNQTFDLYLLQVRMIEERIAVHTEDAGPGKIYKMIVFVSTAWSVGKAGMLGRDGKNHVQNGQPFVTRSRCTFEKGPVLCAK